MYVSFTSAKVIEHSDARAFERRAGRWLTIREAENFYLLCTIPSIDPAADPSIRLFTMEEGGIVVAAGALLSGGMLHLTWATPEINEILVDHAAKHHWQISSISAPAHVSWQFARAYAERVGRSFEFHRAERLYQLANHQYPLPVTGRLENVRGADQALARAWFERFAGETQLEMDPAGVQSAVQSLIESRRLYFWKAPEPVAMAAWVTSSPNGACMNYVFVPPEFRGQAHGKSVSAALAAQMFASGARYCFMLTDVNDARANRLYQSIGARTLCEMLYCRIVAHRSVGKPLSEVAG